MENNHKCPICGEVTSSYMGNYRKDGLCRKHANDLKNGTLSKDENNKWVYGKQFKVTQITNPFAVDKNVKSVERQVQEDGKCIVCGKVARDGALCRDCYYEMIDYMDDFDKNQKVFELSDHYFNLRSAIYRMETFDAVCANSKRLMALAVLTKELYHTTSLTDRVVEDIKEIIKQKSPKIEHKVSKNAEQRDAHREETMRTMDGHYVKSKGERDIDDIFYENRIVHCYEKKVPITSDEPAVVADWFIPVTDSRHGVYVEYWGRNDEEYLKNKARKQKQYKSHNIPLIEIEKDDVLDKHGLTDRILTELNTLAEKYYGVKDFVK